MAEQEQTAAVQEPQTASVTDPIVETDAQAADAASGGAGIDYSQINEEWLRSAADQSDVFRNFLKQREDGSFNAGRQKRDKELRLERGSEDVARALQERWRNKYGVEFDDEDKRDAPLWAAANRAASRVDVARTFIDGELDQFTAEERERIANVVNTLDDDPDTLESVRDQVRNLGRERHTERTIRDLTLAEVPKNSRLRDDLDRHIASEVEKELKARAQERDAVQNPPTTPAGAIPGGQRASMADIKQMSRSQVTNLRKEMGDEAFYDLIAGKA